MRAITEQFSFGDTVPELFHKRDWRVADCTLSEAQELVRRYHYAKGGSNTRTFSHGLYLRSPYSKPFGVAWWIPPTKAAAKANFPEGDWQQVLSLTRLVLAPEIPTNAASFLIAQSVKRIKKDPRWKCLVTYADTWRGHTGTIYRAAGWQYLGLTTPETTFVDSEGAMVARKAGGTTRTRAEMASLGHSLVGRFAKHRYRLLL